MGADDHRSRLDSSRGPFYLLPYFNGIRRRGRFRNVLLCRTNGISTTSLHISGGENCITQLNRYGNRTGVPKNHCSIQFNEHYHQEHADIESHEHGAAGNIFGCRYWNQRRCFRDNRHPCESASSELCAVAIAHHIATPDWRHPRAVQDHSVPQNGFTGSVALKATRMPSTISAAFSSTAITSTGTVSFTSTSLLVPGIYPVSITGTSGSLTNTCRQGPNR
jgi:hypothetical protein